MVADPATHGARPEEDSNAPTGDRRDARRLRPRAPARVREVRREPGGGPAAESDRARAPRRPGGEDHRAPDGDRLRERDEAARRRGARLVLAQAAVGLAREDRKSTRLNSSHVKI